MDIIPCLTWVRRGIAKTKPDKVQLSKDELRKVIEGTKQQLDVLDDDGGDDNDDAEFGKLKAKHEAKQGDDDDDDYIVKEYGLDDYDVEDDEAAEADGLGAFAYYCSNEEDPYITAKDSSDSEDEDTDIKPSDNLIVAGRAEKDASSLEIYVYDENKDSLFVHHDILLPSFPLIVEWLNYDPADAQIGNFVAVGTMLPTIDIWDIDLINSLEPVATLGGTLIKKKGKKKGSVSGHSDAVLDLSWNSHVRNILSSASADFTLGIWDLEQGKIVTRLKKHTEKVQCVSWHPFEAQSLLSGSYDHTVKVYDCRNPNENHKSWTVDGEVERAVWNHFSPFCLLASTDEGMVYNIDTRMDKPVFTLSAHQNAAITGLCLSSEVQDLLVTSSSDKTIKVWDLSNNRPSLVLQRDMGLSELHCVWGCPEAAYLIAVGGSKKLKVWDIRQSADVRKHFEGRTSGQRGIVSSDGDHAIAATATAEQMETESAMGSLTIETDKKATSKKKKRKKMKKKLNSDSS